MFDFTGQTVLITGAAGNLGRALVRAFRGAGAPRLVLLDRNVDEFEQVDAESANSPDAILAYSVDLTDSAQVERVVAEAIGRLGQIDVLVNAAGGYRSEHPVHESALDGWDHLFAINLRTALVVSHAVAPAMVRQGRGKIVNIAARAGLAGGARMAAYSASKAAVIRLTESMAAELKSAGVNVNCVLPSTIDTPANRQAMPKADATRWVKPEALADVILFLASDLARAIHGAAIPVYGTA